MPLVEGQECLSSCESLINVLANHRMRDGGARRGACMPLQEGHKEGHLTLCQPIRRGRKRGLQSPPGGEHLPLLDHLSALIRSDMRARKSLLGSWLLLHLETNSRFQKLYL